MERLHWKTAIWALVAFHRLNYVIAVWWSQESDPIDIHALTQQHAAAEHLQPVPGYTTTTGLITIIDTLLTKSGGYLSNDILPRSVLMDNMPSWEFGALEVVRDTVQVMRRDFARNQSQSSEDPDLAKAHPSLNISNDSWMLPASEDEYSSAMKALLSYRSRLADPADFSAQFYTRADNLSEWLRFVEKRLGTQSQALSASVGRDSINLNMLGDTEAQQSTATPNEQHIKTSWWQIDNNFYEARGTCWALLIMLQAIEVDFTDVLEKKNATLGLKQIMRELEATQQSLWSPMVLNGSGFGMLANHSLVMANYISRANAAVIDLRELLNQG